MENIYKIKVRTNPDPRFLYPSERRYSASTVLGLGVVHLALACTALLLACLSLTANNDIHSTNVLNNDSDIKANLNIIQGESVNTVVLNNGKEDQELIVEERRQNVATSEGLFASPQNYTKTSRDQETSTEAITPENNIKVIENNDQNVKSEGKVNDSQSVPSYERLIAKNESPKASSFTNLVLAPSLMCLGSLAAGLTGLLAWKRWYIDQNIKWFFVMSTLSTVLSAACVILVAATVLATNEAINLGNSGEFVDDNASAPSLKLVIAINILIAASLELLWSVLSSKISFNGMRQDYPDDIIISKSRGRVQVNTIHKGNKKGKIIPPDIINHFPIGSKLAKFFPKKHVGNLPKDESQKEYQERVNKFLCSQIDGGVK